MAQVSNKNQIYISKNFIKKYKIANEIGGLMAAL